MTKGRNGKERNGKERNGKEMCVEGRKDKQTEGK